MSAREVGKSTSEAAGATLDLSLLSDDDDGGGKPAAKSRPRKRRASTDTPEIVVDLSQDDDDEVQDITALYQAVGKSVASRKFEEDDEIQVIEHGRTSETTADVASNLPSKKKHRQAAHLQDIIVVNQQHHQQSFDCEICLEDSLEEWRGFTLNTCGHRFCLLCLSNHIRHSPTTKIPCPSCKEQMDMVDIRSILQMVGYGSASAAANTDSKELSWQSFSERASLDLLEREIAGGDHGTCRCPTNLCNYTFVFEDNGGAQGVQFDCPQCKKSYCLHCGATKDRLVGPAHPTMSCHDRREQLEGEEEERRKLEAWKKENSQADAKFKELMEKEQKRGQTKPCPSCKTPITKNG